MEAEIICGVADDTGMSVKEQTAYPERYGLNLLLHNGEFLRVLHLLHVTDVEVNKNTALSVGGPIENTSRHTHDNEVGNRTIDCLRAVVPDTGETEVSYRIRKPRLNVGYVKVVLH